MKVSCPKCSNVWEYKGKSTYYACCPNCKKSVNIHSSHKSPISKRVVPKGTSLKN